jgi:hypothetical protein
VGIVVRFDEYDALVRVWRRLFIRNLHFRDGFPWAEYFGNETRALIVANHGPIIGPLVWVAALFPRIVDLGCGHLTYSAIAHPIIRNIPIFARMVGYQKRQGKRLRADDYVELLQQGRLNILSVAPEGEYALYGNGVDIQPFRSARSLEIALRADCPIVLAVGSGFEHWQRTVSIEPRWRKRLAKRLALQIPFLDKLDEEALARADRISISGMFGRIPDFTVATELYQPVLTRDALSDDRATRDEQLWAEAERVRSQMKRMLADIRGVGL